MFAAHPWRTLNFLKVYLSSRIWLNLPKPYQAIWSFLNFPENCWTILMLVEFFGSVQTFREDYLTSQKITKPLWSSLNLREVRRTCQSLLSFPTGTSLVYWIFVKFIGPPGISLIFLKFSWSSLIGWSSLLFSETRFTFLNLLNFTEICELFSTPELLQLSKFSWN